MKAALALLAASAGIANASLSSMMNKEQLSSIKDVFGKYAKVKADTFNDSKEKKLFQNTVTVQTQYGPVIGLGPSTATNVSINQFLGVPYAAAPVGHNRWRSPQPLASKWATNGTLDATNYRATCIQDDWLWTIYGGMSEDCLHLNIFTPGDAAAGKTNYPVMFFIHGGSFVYGSGSFPLYDGQNDVNTLQDAIIVTINYRLGIFGYLAGDLLKKESPDGSVGNYGFQDQRAAMAWTFNNIAAFGGDPSRIMIFGESAGGGSVSAHLVSPKSWPYFSRAIIESGAWADWTAQPYSISGTRLPQVASNLGCSAEPDVLACMRTMSYQDIQNADNKNVTQAFLEWGTVIDGVEIVDSPRTLLKQGLVANVPIVMGFNADEGTLFNANSVDLAPEEFEAAISKVLGPVLAPEVAAVYDLSNYRSPWWAVSSMMGDAMLLCPAQLDAAQLVSGTTKRPTNLGTFVYYMTAELAITHIIEDLRKVPLGVFHGSELAFVFGAFETLMFGPGEHALSALYARYWTRFAATGNPNGGSDPVWPDFGASNGQITQLSVNPGLNSYNVTLVENVNQNTCNFWFNHTVPSNALYGL